MSNTPALDAYLARVGAEQLNFRRWIIKDHRGEYYIEVALITINADKTFTVSDNKYEPSEAEREQIEAEIQKLDFPKSIVAPAAKVKAQTAKLKGSKVYELYSRKEKGVLMLQERKETPEGKRYIPWTFWSDGKWRAMEPDGALPFFKPVKKKSSFVMIHEGPKAAEAAAKVKKGHPWFEELSRFEHWGVIGGALAPHRADYSELEAERPAEVVYMADNDWPGKSALQKVSTCWGKSLKGIFLTDDFPAAWDIADPMPKELFKSKVWIGPTLGNLMIPATQATKLIPNPEGRGRPLTVLTDDFKREWVHTVDPEVFIHRDWPNHMRTADQFNSLVAPYSHLKDTAGHVRRDQSGKVNGIQYTPARPSGLFFDEISGGSFVNVYSPSTVDSWKGDAGPFLDYMERVFPDDGDREHLLKWVATLVARPEVRMTYSVLLISRSQGVGKTTLGEKILAPLVGLHNCSFPREKDISDSSFNGWLAKKRLVLVNEIYAGKSLKAYNILKQIISDKMIEVNEKFMRGYTVDNWAHVVACSNSFRALKIDTDDRRWLIPEVVEETQPEEYWISLNEWLASGGLHHIKQWAEDYVKTKGYVKPGEHAPYTSLREDIAQQSLTPGMRIMRRMIDDVKEQHPDGEFFTTDYELHSAIMSQIEDATERKFGETLLDVRKEARSAGFFVGGQTAGHHGLGINGARHRVLSLHRPISKLSPIKLVENRVLFLNSRDLAGISREPM